MLKFNAWPPKAGQVEFTDVGKAMLKGAENGEIFDGLVYGLGSLLVANGCSAEEAVVIGSELAEQLDMDKENLQPYFDDNLKFGIEATVLESQEGGAQ